MVGPIKGYGGLRPSEEGRRGWLGHIDLAARKLLAALGVVGHRSSKDHEATIWYWKAIILLLGIVHGGGRVLSMLPFVGTS